MTAASAAPADSKISKVQDEHEIAEWQPADGNKQIPIWPSPSAIPSKTKVAKPENLTTCDPKGLIGGKSVVGIHNVSQPTMIVYPAKGKNTGAAVMVYPGGGYWMLAVDLEGTEICDWLTSRGITAVLLKYRVPGYKRFPRTGPYPKNPLALQDAQRALRLVRSQAAKWQIDPHKIGVLGFSAGGHLSAAMSNHYNTRTYTPVDATDKVSCRPDFAVVLYPGHLNTEPNTLGLVSDIKVTKNTPPQFILQAENDPVDDVGHSIAYFAALKKAGVPAEMHIYAQGGHAFGLRKTKYPITEWPKLVDKWFETTGIVPEQK